MNFPTYENAQFHRLLSIYFGVGAGLNIGYGVLAEKSVFLLNGILLGVLSFGMYKLYRIYLDKKKREVQNTEVSLV